MRGITELTTNLDIVTISLHKLKIVAVLGNVHLSPSSTVLCHCLMMRRYSPRAKKESTMQQCIFSPSKMTEIVVHSVLNK